MPAATPMTRLPTALGKRVIPLPAASSVPAPCAARARTALAEWAVQPPVLQRLGQVTALDPGLSRQVGNGPGQLENPVIGSGRQPHSERGLLQDRKSTRLNSSHVAISYAVFCLKKKT